MRHERILILVGAVLLTAAAGMPSLRARAAVAKHELPAATHGGTVVGMCDGKTSLEVTDLAPGESLDPARAQEVSDELMAAWRKANPGARWDATLAANEPAPKPAGPPAGAKEATQSGIYGNFSSRDEEIWAAETQKFIDEGSAIFHDPKKLGGGIGVSCGNCHPNGANTHPETYPKFQVQLHRVALLRDMINWCIENPVKGKPLADDDPKLRALEAYILSTRKGVPLEYGKH